MGADTKANTLRCGGELERLDRRRRGEQLAQHDSSRHADAISVPSRAQVELHDAVLAQGGERDPAEVGHDGVLEHHIG